MVNMGECKVPSKATICFDGSPGIGSPSFSAPAHGDCITLALGIGIERGKGGAYGA